MAPHVYTPANRMLLSVALLFNIDNGLILRFKTSFMNTAIKMSYQRDYGSWTLQELKSELRKRNAKLAGLKKELVER